MDNNYYKGHRNQRKIVDEIGLSYTIDITFYVKVHQGISFLLMYRLLVWSSSCYRLFPCCGAQSWLNCRSIPLIRSIAACAWRFAQPIRLLLIILSLPSKASTKGWHKIIFQSIFFNLFLMSDVHLKKAIPNDHISATLNLYDTVQKYGFHIDFKKLRWNGGSNHCLIIK